MNYEEKNLTPEQKIEAKNNMAHAKTAEELKKLGEEAGIMMTLEEAKSQFENIAALSDEDLDNVAGGLVFDGDEEKEEGPICTKNNTMMHCYENYECAMNYKYDGDRNDSCIKANTEWCWSDYECATIYHQDSLAQEE